MAVITDVAKEAGVSKATVSNVFSGKRPVRQEVREHVLEAAKKLDYKPNFFARTLTTKETRIIGIGFRGENSKLSNFHLVFINGVLQVCCKYGYRTLINVQPSIYNNKVELQTSDCVDGVILLDPSDRDSRIEYYLKKDIHVVVIGRPPQKNETEISFVDNDNIEISKELTNYLIRLGHRNIVFLNTTKLLTVSQDREKGYKTAFKNAGLIWNQENILYKPEGMASFKYGYDSIKEILIRRANITAVIADNAPVAQGVYHSLYELNYKIPDNVSITAFGDSSDYSLIPSLTCINLNSEMLGMKAAELLIEHCTSKNNIVQRLIISANLLLGNSVNQVTHGK